MLLLVDLSGKAAWRSSLLVARRGIDPRSAARDELVRDLVRGRSVAAYTSFGTEPSTLALVQPDWLLPVLLPDNDLSWAADGVDLGVDAIADVDVVLVPALAVSRDGVRLGRGGGSYDRALRRARGLVLALLHEGELVDALPSEPHDVRVDGVVLPSGVVTLTVHG